MDTSQSLGITSGEGHFYGNDDLQTIELMLELGGEMLLQDHTYQIKFLSPTVKTLLKRVSQNIHSTQVGESFDENVSFELVNEGGDPYQISQNFDTLDNPGDYDTESPTIREFMGDDNLTFEGPIIGMDLGDLSNFPTIEEIELRIEGDYPLTVSPGAITAALND
jgi:hypothetical protein